MYYWRKSMSKLIVHVLISLDGYNEDTNKNVHGIWKYHHKDYLDDISFHLYNAERLRSARTLLLGASTIKGFNDQWRNILNDPKASTIARELALLIVPLEKLVVSDTLSNKDLNPEDRTRIVKRADAYKVVAELKQQPGKDLFVIGSRTLWQNLLAQDLVDELHFTIAPVFAGSGTPLFDSQPEVFLKRIETRIPDKSGNTIICYEVSHKK